MKTLFLFSCFFLANLWGQDIHVGVKGGVPLTHGVSPDSLDESKRYTVGPSVEVGVWRGLSFEFDALYKRVGYTQRFSLIGVSQTTRQRGNSWEFPMLAKYSFGHREASMKPFVEVGGSLRKIWASRQFSLNSPDPLILLPHDFDDVTRLQAGGVAGAGVLFRYGRFGISPEVRYTRWAVTNFPTNRNQAEVLVGIRF